MIGMSAQRKFRSALGRADRNREYSIEFEELTPQLMDEIRTLLSEGEEALIQYAENFTPRMSEEKRRKVVGELLDQFQNILENSLMIQLGKLGVEGPSNAPTKTMSDIYEMEGSSAEDWFSNNKQDLYDKFINGDFRPLFNTYTFFKAQGLEEEYQNTISTVKTNEEVDNALPLLDDTNREKITGDSVEILQVFREIDTSRLPELKDVLGGGKELTPLGELREITPSDVRNFSSEEQLQNFLELIISANSRTNNTSVAIASLADLAIVPLTTFVRRLFRTSSNKDGVQFLNLFANLVSRRGETQTEGKFRLGAGDLVPTGQMLRDFYDFEKPDEPYQEWVRDRDTAAFNTRLEAFVSRGENRNLTRQRRTTGGRELLAYYGAGSPRRGKIVPNFAVGIQPDQALPSLVGFIQLFDSSFNLNDVPAFRSIDFQTQADEIESQLNDLLVEGMGALRRGMVGEFNDVLEIIYNRPGMSFKSVGGMSALEFLEELDIIERD